MSSSEAVSRTRQVRAPNQVDFFLLYDILWQYVKKQTDGKGVADGTTWAFSRNEIELVLIMQHIKYDDLGAAVKHCLEVGMLEEREDGFHFTAGTLANYHALLRRI